MVYTDAIPLEENLAKPYEQALSQSLSLWEEASQGLLQFRFSPSAVAADIRIKWVDQRRRGGMYENIGEAMLIRKGEGFHVEIEILLRNKRTLELLDPGIVQAALLHEIGHAIGLWGHSEDENDVMYFAVTAQKPTARDVETWLKVRKTPVNTPFHAQAIAALQAEAQKAPAIAANSYARGTVYADLGDYPAAIEAFQNALEVDPSIRFSAVQLAQIFQQKGLYNLAIAHYRRALRTKPSAEVLGALGTLLLLQGEFNQAVDFFQRALRRAPDSATLNQNLLAAYHRWGFQHLKANQFSEAIKCFNRGLGRFPFSEILLYDLAVTHESAGESEKALDIYERVLEIDPQYASAKIGIATTLNNLGAQHARNGDWQEAKALHQRALTYQPDSSHARQNLEATLMQIGWEKNLIGDLDGAILTYEELLEINPKNAQAHNNLGIIYFKNWDYQKSKAHLETALALVGNYEEAKTNLDYVQKQYAFEIMKRAIGPVLIVLLVCFLIMKVTMKRAENRLAATGRQRLQGRNRKGG